MENTINELSKINNKKEEDIKKEIEKEFYATKEEEIRYNNEVKEKKIKELEEKLKQKNQDFEREMAKYSKINKINDEQAKEIQRLRKALGLRNLSEKEKYGDLSQKTQDEIKNESTKEKIYEKRRILKKRKNLKQKKIKEKGNTKMKKKKKKRRAKKMMMIMMIIVH